MVIVGREGSRVDRTFCSESLLMFKTCGVKELERRGRGESVMGTFLGRTDGLSEHREGHEAH